MKSGAYNINILKPDFFFGSPSLIELSPNDVVLGNVIAKEYSVCGMFYIVNLILHNITFKLDFLSNSLLKRLKSLI